MEQPNGPSRSRTDVHRIEIGIEWPPEHVVVYLIAGPEPVLVDAGMSGERSGEQLRAGLDSLGYPPSEIEHVVVTHPHVDHIGQIPGLIESNSPTIYAPRGVRDRFARDPADLERTVRKNAREAGLAGDGIEEAVEKSVNSLVRNRELLVPEQVDEWIEDGQEFSVADITFKAIHTPGHQADHLSYDTLLGDRPVLFSGDLLIQSFRAIMVHTGLDDGVGEAVPAFLGSLDRLAKLGNRRIYPGHGPVHDDLPGTVERSRENIERMIERTAESVAEGRTAAVEIAKRRSRDRSFHHVLPEVVSALSHLQSRNRIDSTLEDGVRYYHTNERV